MEVYNCMVIIIKKFYSMVNTLMVQVGFRFTPLKRDKVQQVDKKVTDLFYF